MVFGVLLIELVQYIISFLSFEEQSIFIKIPKYVNLKVTYLIERKKDQIMLKNGQMKRMGLIYDDALFKQIKYSHLRELTLNSDLYSGFSHPTSLKNLIHLTKLSIPKLSKLTDDIHMLVNLTDLDIRDCKLVNPYLTFKNLLILRCSHSNIVSIDGCPNLIELSQNANIKKVDKFVRLKKLHVHFGSIYEINLPCLTNLRCENEITVSSPSIITILHAEKIPVNFYKMTNITNLTIHVVASDTDIGHLRNLTSLTIIQSFGKKGKITCIDQITGLSKLYLKGTNDAYDLTKNVNIKILDMNDVSVPPINFEYLQLEELSLKDVWCKIDISEFITLKKLNLNNVKMSQKDIKNLIVLKEIILDTVDIQDLSHLIALESVTACFGYKLKLSSVMKLENLVKVNFLNKQKEIIPSNKEEFAFLKKIELTYLD